MEKICKNCHYFNELNSVEYGYCGNDVLDEKIRFTEGEVLFYPYKDFGCIYWEGKYEQEAEKKTCACGEFNCLCYSR